MCVSWSQNRCRFGDHCCHAHFTKDSLNALKVQKRKEKQENSTQPSTKAKAKAKAKANKKEAAKAKAKAKGKRKANGVAHVFLADEALASPLNQ
jgi:hypothetical protein